MEGLPLSILVVFPVGLAIVGLIHFCLEDGDWLGKLMGRVRVYRCDCGAKDYIYRRSANRKTTIVGECYRCGNKFLFPVFEGGFVKFIIKIKNMFKFIAKVLGLLILLEVAIYVPRILEKLIGKL